MDTWLAKMFKNKNYIAKLFFKLWPKTLYVYSYRSIYVGHAQSSITGLKNCNRFIKKTISYKGKINLSVHIEVHVQLFIMFYKLRPVKVKFSKS